MKDTTIYLGEGVYAEWDGFQIKLMANSHEEPTDVVYLEPQVLEALNNWMGTIKKTKG